METESTVENKYRQGQPVEAKLTGLGSRKLASLKVVFWFQPHAFSL
jgi:hypothetical protein